ncbi:alpha/beta hydrolase [Frigoribacterium sp. PhB160]|uniref:alpha/beta hydrolase n=1 Tax=Frigoribacterium sp. PhB160 TaxID=2485192 RepID=UPI0013153790|nr:alpha/beta hydrolase fold domain-containing protein [Frigoribacterium sp. PhB160]
MEIRGRDELVDGVPVRWYDPGVGDEVGGPGPTLLWLHGGGFFRGGLDQPEAHDVAIALARRGVTVATVDYRLAPPPGMPWVRTAAGRPRGRYPAALDDVLAALHAVGERSPGGVVVGGASAGACIAAGAVLRASDEGRPPVGSVLAYGFFHALHPRARDASQRSPGRRRLTHAPRGMDAANRNYVGSRSSLGERHAFPGGHDLRGFPPTLVVNAERDNMRASGDLFAAELAAAGTAVEHHVLPGTRHAFLDRPSLDEFAETIGLTATWLRSGRPGRQS